MNKLSFSELKNDDVVSIEGTMHNGHFYMSGLGYHNVMLEDASFTLISRVRAKVKKYYLVIKSSANKHYEVSVNMYSSVEAYRLANETLSYRAVSRIEESMVEVDE